MRKSNLQLSLENPLQLKKSIIFSLFILTKGRIKQEITIETMI